jgi:hypothetical protein
MAVVRSESGRLNRDAAHPWSNETRMWPLQHRRQAGGLEVNDYRTTPVIDNQTALLWMLAGLVAGVLGFRDLNVTYLHLFGR